jgi:hypothetical protein
MENNIRKFKHITQNAMDFIALEQMKAKIETMSKTNHIEILKILKKNPTVKLNENKSGVFINLSFLPKSVLDEITEYLNYIQDQEVSLNTMETQKECFKNSFFGEKGDKDNAPLSYTQSYSK